VGEEMNEDGEPMGRGEVIGLTILSKETGACMNE